MRHFLCLILALLLTCTSITPALAAGDNSTPKKSTVSLGCEIAADLQHVNSGDVIAISNVYSEPLNVTAAVTDNTVMQACANCNKRIPAGAPIEPAYALYDATGSPGTARQDATDDIALQHTALTVLKPQTAGTAPPLRC